MGCFNQSCTISRLDIQREEKCALIPIIENPKSESLNDHCFRLYQPFCLPIFGVYDDYGSIEKIQRDRNVELIEKYFEISIEKFVECVTRRRELYGEGSLLQEAYGQPKCVITKESLAKAGFITNSKGEVTHTQIDKAFDGIEEDKRKHKKAKMYWDDTGLVIEGVYTEPKHFDKGEEPRKFLEMMHHYLIHLKELHRFSFGNEFIFCISPEKQGHAHLLRKFKDSFVRADVYEQLATQYAAYIAKNRSTDIQGATKEFMELTEKWQKAVKRYKSAKPLTEKSSMDERVNRIELHDAACKPSDLWYHPFIDCFKTTRTGEEFLALYGAELSSPKILKQLIDFFHVSAGMVHGNALLVDTNSHEQHGDIEAQIELAGIYSKIAKKIQNDRY